MSENRRRGGLVVGVHNAPHAHEPHALVHEVPVLSRPHVHHPAPVLRLLIHQPVAVHHVAGHAVGHAVVVLDVITVVHHLVHLAAEVLPLVDPHPVLASVLEGGEEGKGVSDVKGGLHTRTCLVKGGLHTRTCLVKGGLHTRTCHVKGGLHSHVKGGLHSC